MTPQKELCSAVCTLFFVLFSFSIYYIVVLSCNAVLCRCDGSYLEDQDKWWLSGIYREVYLLRKDASAFIADYECSQIITFEEESIASGKSVTCPVATEVKLKFDVFVEGDGLIDQKESTSNVSSRRSEGLEVRVEIYEAASLRDQVPEQNLKSNHHHSAGRGLQWSQTQNKTQSERQTLPRGVAPVLTISASLNGGDEDDRINQPPVTSSANIEDVHFISTAEHSAPLGSFNSSLSVPTRRISLTGSFSSPHLWTAETPHLYTVVLSIYHSDNSHSHSRSAIADDIRALDVEAFRVGIREVKVGGADHQLMVNRVPITVAGVNRHEFDSAQGRAVSEASMQLDVTLMKKLNFNAVRLSHYPTHHRFMEICDAIGLYVCDEVNIETHGFQVAGQPVAYLSSLPEWKGAHMSRIIRMVERDKNSSSVILWSLGNESGVGPSHVDMYEWLKGRDVSRVIQYEAGGSASGVTDVICPMYQKPRWCVDMALHDEKKR